MPAIAALYEDLALKAAKANLTHEAFLYELVRAECLQHEDHRVASFQCLAGLPPDKTFSSSCHSSASRRRKSCNIRGRIA